MILNHKVVVVMPAYNATQTLAKTLNEVPMDVVDDIVLVDDCSSDDTYNFAIKLGIKHVVKHQVNKGYGGNQKTCYQKALDLNADIVVMLHPDYQYTPKLIRSMVSIIADGNYKVVLGSRILGKGALKGGMPIYKYIANRLLTLFQNILFNEKLSEYHTGYRVFHKDVLNAIALELNDDDFIFDNQMLAQIFAKGFEICEVTCPTKYFDEASSINFKRSAKYGMGVLWVSVQYRLMKWGLLKPLYLVK